MNHAYTSFNKAVAAHWSTIAPGVSVIYEHPAPPDTMPAECLRIYWLEPGGPTRQPNELMAMVQLDVFVPGNDRAKALDRAKRLDTALGFHSGGGFGEMGRFDYGTTPETLLSMMRVEPFESGWQQIPDPQPGLVHYARTVILTYTV